MKGLLIPDHLNTQTISGYLAISAEGQEHGSGKEHTIYFAGDHIQMILTGEFEPDSIHPGYLICRGGQVRYFI